MSCYIGINIGGTKTSAGIVTDTSEVLIRKHCLTPIKQGGPQILQSSIALAAELLECTDQKAEGIGIGAGGQIDSKNGIVYSATDVLPNWRGTHVAEAFSKQLGLKTFVDNDVNVLAIAETRFGAAATLSTGTIIFLFLDVGVGGALVSNGSIHHGASWSGGEFGQILLTMDPHARRGPGGSIGTLEAYCSTLGLLQTWHELTGNFNKITVNDIVIDAKSNPTGASSAAIAKTGEYLGYGLVSLANTVNPHAIIIGGELSSLGDDLLNPARQIFQQRTLPGSISCSITAAKLGPDAAIIGAASLAMRKVTLLEAITASTHS
jgi:glucokinase